VPSCGQALVDAGDHAGLQRLLQDKQRRLPGDAGTDLVVLERTVTTKGGTVSIVDKVVACLKEPAKGQ
jgi:hypothetical protein